MGVDAADFDGDGDEDLFMTHLARETNTLYVNDGTGWFEDQTIAMGLSGASFAYTGFGAAWFDYDNNGLLDLLIVNGAVTRIAAQAEAGDPHPLHQTNQLFANLGNGRYGEVTAEAGSVFRLSEVSRGAVFGDIDNDGDTDVLITKDGTGWFEDQTIAMGLSGASFAYTGFGAAWFDYDNNGLLDLLIVNGAHAHAGGRSTKHAWRAGSQHGRGRRGL